MAESPPPGAEAGTDGYWQIEGPFDSSYSLAVVNRELARALKAGGRDVGLRSREGSGEFVPSADFLLAHPDCAALARRAEAAGGIPDVALRFCYPPHVADMAGRIKVLHSYGWEESGFPAEYVEAFNRHLDLITVLSRPVAKILRDAGVRIPIAVTGAGADHLLGVTPQMPGELQGTARSFRFLHISSCFPRKGLDALLWAYGQAFRASDEVSLVIKTFANPHNDVAQQLARFRESDADYPHVLLIERDFSEAELAGLYQACQAFVAPSRGEGFGLPLAEAMLFGLPVITTAWGGQTDFCDQTTAWLCDYVFAKSQSHFGLTHSAWADPDIEMLARLLREVFTLGPEQRTQRTAPARQRILAEHTWQRAAQRTEQAIRALEAQTRPRRAPRIGWLSTWHKRCGIAAYSAFLTMAIPNDRLSIFADRAAERTAPDEPNVQRCWDLSFAETLDETYAAILGQGIEAVVIQYNMGFYSLGTFASLIERLRQAGISVHCFFHATGDLLIDGEPVSLGSIAPTLAKADRLYVHSLLDLNRLKKFGLVNNVILFPQGVLDAPTPDPAEASSLANEFVGASLLANEDHREQARSYGGPEDHREQARSYGSSEGHPDQARSHHRRIIASYGYLLPHKGLPQLIEAFAQLAATDDTWHLLLVNALYPLAISEQERQTCTDLIAQLQLDGRVTLVTDYLSDEQSLALLQLAELIVFPYQRTQESSSAAVRIGLASHRPVAVTPLTIFDDVADAVHFLPGITAQAIADGLRDLLTDPVTVAHQAAKTERWLKARQWPLLSQRLLNIIDSV